MKSRVGAKAAGPVPKISPEPPKKMRLSETDQLDLWPLSCISRPLYLAAAWQTLTRHSARIGPQSPLAACVNHKR
jgi:hypothetical protein